MRYDSRCAESQSERNCLIVGGLKCIAFNLFYGDTLRAFAFASIALFASSISAPSLANSWRAMPLLDPSSPFLCRQADVSAVVLEFSENGSELKVRTPQNDVFAFPIAADGLIKGAIAVPVGRRHFAVDLTGNVRQRTLQIYNKQYDCRFSLRPTG